MEMEPSTLHIDLGDSAQPAGTAGAAGTAGTARKAGTAGKAGPAEQAGPSGPTGQQGRRGWRGLLRQSPIGPLASPSLGRLSRQRIPSAYILQLPMWSCYSRVRWREEGEGVRAENHRQDFHRSSFAVDADAGHVCPTGRVSLARSATAERRRIAQPRAGLSLTRVPGQRPFQ